MNIHKRKFVESNAAYSQLSDYIGWAQYRIPGLHQAGCCSLKSLPLNSQDAKEDFMNDVIKKAKNRKFPHTLKPNEKCLPLPSSTVTRYCNNTQN